MSDDWTRARAERVLLSSPPFEAHPPLARALARAGKMRAFAPEDEVIAQGGDDQDVYVILSGSVDVRVHDQLIAVRAAVTHVGEMAALNPSARRSATVTARERVECLVLRAEQIEKIGSKFPELYRHFARELARRLERRSHPPAATPATLLGPRTLRGLTQHPDLHTLYAGDQHTVFLRSTRSGLSLGATAAEDLRDLAGRGDPPALNAWLRRAHRMASPELRPLLEAAIRELTLTPGAPPSARLERARHRGGLLPVGFAAGLAEAARSVVHLTVPAFRGDVPRGPSRGTGWLAAPTLVVTAWHVVGAFDDAADTPSEPDLARQLARLELRFDYDARHTFAEKPHVHALELVAREERLDVAILRLPEAADRRPLRCVTDEVRVAPSAPGHANVIQHPEGKEKRLAIRSNHLYDRDGDRLRYHSDTLPGSSGAPVLDDHGRVIAVHTSSPDLEAPVDYQGEAAGWLNCGTAIDTILAWLQRDHPQLAAEIIAVG